MSGDGKVEVRLRVSLDEALALRRLLRGRPAEPGDNALLDRVEQHVGSVYGTVTKRPSS